MENPLCLLRTRVFKSYDSYLLWGSFERKDGKREFLYDFSSHQTLYCLVYFTIFAIFIRQYEAIYACNVGVEKS